MFHYHHAVRRKRDKNDELNSILEYFMQIINPEMHKEYLKIKESTDIQVATYNEDMEDSDFAKYIAAAEARYKHQPQLEAPRVHDIVEAEPEAPKVEPPKRNPLQWGRPPDLPPLVAGNGTPPDDDTDFNPVSFTKWE